MEAQELFSKIKCSTCIRLSCLITHNLANMNATEGNLVTAKSLLSEALASSRYTCCAYKSSYKEWQPTFGCKLQYLTTWVLIALWNQITDLRSPITR